MADQISKLINQQGRAAGIPQNQIAKAIRQIKSGKIDMTQVTPHLTDMMLQQQDSGNLSTEQIRQRMQQKRHMNQMKRLPKHVQKRQAQLKADQIKERREQRQAERELKELEQRQRQIERLQELAQLAKVTGRVTDQLYHKCLSDLDSGKCKTEQVRQRYQNLVDLYQQQNQLTGEIKETKLDDLLEDEDEGELSDVSM